MPVSSVPIGKVRVGAGGPGDWGGQRVAWALLAPVAHDPVPLATPQVRSRTTIAAMLRVKVMAEIFRSND